MRYRESKREIERWRKEIGRERKRKERSTIKREKNACVGFYIV